jgi:alkylated DNA repair protein (DNA oxidative demethylase)
MTVGQTTLWDGPGRRTIVPGAVHLPGFLDLDQQRHLVAAFDAWCAGPVPIRAARLPGGHRMSVQMVCLGWHWQPYRYTRTADDVNGAPVLAVPDWLSEVGRSVLDAAYGHGAGAGYRPDTVLANRYDGDARLGMHQDKVERADDPVVSLSVGDACRFRFGNVEHRGRPWTDVELASGDAFAFGGPARFAYHGVPKVHPGTAPPGCGLAHGRINLTMRVTGLSEPTS